MSKKDYELIANVIREAEEKRLSILGLSRRLARKLKENNDHFDSGLFLKACGFQGYDTER